MLTSYCETSLETIILGDLNANYLNKKLHKELKDITTVNGYTQLIDTATRVTSELSTLIDVILTNNPYSISNTGWRCVVMNFARATSWIIYFSFYSLACQCDELFVC